MLTLAFPISDKEILACGAELKGSICITKGRQAYLSDPLGDLKDWDNYQGYLNQINSLKKSLGIDPKIVVHDLHPAYLSTKYALEQKETKQIAIQHHRAHIASGMLDNNLDGEVIGVALDGLGYGDDGNLWGFEIFQGRMAELERVGHLQYIPQPGGDAATKAPYRMAFSYLVATFGEEVKESGFFKAIGYDEKRIEAKEQKAVLEIIEKKINSPLTSSAGRLFDAVSSLLGIKDYAAKDGEAAIALEKAANPDTKSMYEIIIEVKNGGFEIDPKMMIKMIVNDIKKGTDRAEIAGKFHNTIVEIIVSACQKVKHLHGTDRVVLSGGVFQNKIIMQKLPALLEEQKFNVYTHKQVPTHDGGIAFGQAAIAALCV